MNYYRKLVALRKSDELKEVFTYGEFLPEYEKCGRSHGILS